MSEYELYHSAARKHKYIKKIGNRYFYSQHEIDAYLNKDKIERDDIEYDRIERDDIEYDRIERDDKKRDRIERDRTSKSRNNIRKSSAVEDAQERGKKQTSKINARKTIDSDQQRGKARTEQVRKAQKTTKQNSNKLLNNMKKQAAKGKKALKYLYANRPKLGHHTTITSNGETKDYYY